MRENTYDRFLDIPCKKEMLDIYVVRRSILQSIRDAFPHFQGRLLDAGCGKMPYRELIINDSQVKNYVGLDIESAIEYDKSVKPDFTWDGITMPFDASEFDVVFATEVLEHCPDPQQFINESFRVLKNGGVFFFTVPFLWPLHEVPNDAYRYTPFTLEKMFSNAGFSEIDMKALGGWHASMAQMLGLWTMRSPMSSLKRKMLMRLMMPIVKGLLKLDSHASKRFVEGQMITGLTGLIKK